LLADGVDAVGPAPRGRFGKESKYAGGFLERIDEFDAEFFGVSGREAEALDPQHRLLLEVAWEALESAGVVPATLGETATGVYVGIGTSEYLRLGKDGGPHALSGGAMSFAAGRLAYTLGLQGPALAIDTACSSSLVALHQACQALRSGECTFALACGVHLMVGAAPFETLEQTGALADDGRCKTFSAAAGGYGRGEGAVVVALQRLSEAQASGRRILGVVRGSAVNHDGASSGITAPNGSSQQKVVRAALAQAGVAAREVDYVECHGTGTPLGDPIEVQALAAVYGEGRAINGSGAEARPLLLGAVKTNVGHLESAAGLAGVAKVLASLRAETLPATLHTQPPNPHVAWDQLPVRVVTTSQPWTPRASGERRRAGVSAFGLSGTNAHVIIEEAPSANAETAAAPAAAVAEAAGPVALLLSGKTEAALAAQAARLREHLTTRPSETLTDVAAALATKRTHFAVRAAIVVPDRAAALTGLAAVAAGEAGEGVSVILGKVQRGKLAYLFTGQGSQRVGMGRALYERFPAFADAFDGIAAHLDRTLPRRLGEVLFAAEDGEGAAAAAETLNETVFAQAALFAVEISVCRLLESWGITPDILLGHSIGELAAAHVAGVFTVEDACALVAARATLMQALPGGGAMLAVQASEAEVRALLDSGGWGIDVAAVNGPRAVTVAGAADAIALVAAASAAASWKTKRLAVSHAFHSRQMDQMLAAFRVEAERVRYAPPQIAMVSSVTGKLATGAE
ncbi:MAG TPA: type I polyketide synthase, partial [Ktedonobacterales bacterium]|nr:type I polyketide synthase [Ktedonobacterales bacterium]